MIDKLVEVVVAVIILVVGFGIFLITQGADPQVATSLITAVTEVGVFVIVAGIVTAIPLAIFAQAGR